MFTHMCKENVFLKNVLVILSQCSSRYLFRPLEERELGFRVTSSNRAEAQTRIVTLTLFFFVCRSRDLRWDQRRRLSELLAAERGCTFAATEMSAVWTNVQDEAQSEDPHEIRMRGSEEFSLSHMPFQLHAEHQSAPSSYAAARHLSAAEVLGTKTHLSAHIASTIYILVKKRKKKPVSTFFGQRVNAVL